MKTKNIKFVINNNLIESYIKENKITKKEFCNRCGFSYVALKHVMEGRGSLLVSQYAKVAKVLKVALKDFVLF